MPALVAIVEGQSEVQSVGVLLRRVMDDLGVYSVQVARPFRVKRTSVVKEGELERAVKLALMDRSGAEAVLVLLDADDDCPVCLANRLRERVASVTDKPCAVVVAQREFEAWFLGAEESLRGCRGIREDATCPPDPEAIRGAKEELSRNMANGRYLEVDDQPALAEAFDLDRARSACQSFDKFMREAERLLRHIA